LNKQRRETFKLETTHHLLMAYWNTEKMYCIAGSQSFATKWCEALFWGVFLTCQKIGTFRSEKCICLPRLFSR
jgi:hypothetical protein